jgi:hypothetical protein
MLFAYVSSDTPLSIPNLLLDSSRFWNSMSPLWHVRRKRGKLHSVLRVWVADSLGGTGLLRLYLTAG